MEKFEEMIGPTRRYYIPHYFLNLILIGLTIYFHSVIFLVWALPILIIIIFIYTEIHHASLARLTVDQDGLFLERKFLNRSSINLDFINIYSIELHQTVFGRILNYGNLEFNARGKSDKGINLVHIANPVEVKNKIDILVGKSKYKK